MNRECFGGRSLCEPWPWVNRATCQSTRERSSAGELATWSSRAFTEEQVRWLEAICDHIAGSVSMEMGDFQYAPFNQQGGLGKAYELFGDELEGLLEELNLELVA